MSTLFVSGSVNISGTYLKNGENISERKVNITTEEHAKGEKFLGRDVYIRGWEGTLNSTGWQTIVANFFPSSSCHVVSLGGESVLAGSNEGLFLSTYIASGWQRQVRRLGSDLEFVSAGDLVNCNTRVWVKYTHE
jgi:hypothetical protein